MRARRLLTAAAVLAIVAGLALAGWWLAGREPGLPAGARAALSSAVSSQGDGGSGRLQLFEVERIGPDFAVIYRSGRQPGAALLIGGEGTWSVEGVPDPGALVPPAGTAAGAVSLVADGLQVVFLGVSDRRVARVAVRFPADGTVLNAPRRRGYAIVWRPAGPVPLSYLVETYGAGGKRLSP